jgi:hypothetical protein
LIVLTRPADVPETSRMADGRHRSSTVIKGRATTKPQCFITPELAYKECFAPLNLVPESYLSSRVIRVLIATSPSKLPASSDSATRPRHIAQEPLQLPPALSPHALPISRPNGFITALFSNYHMPRLRPLSRSIDCIKMESHQSYNYDFWIFILVVLLILLLCRLEDVD